MPDLTQTTEILLATEGLLFTPSMRLIDQSVLDNQVGRILDSLGGPNFLPYTNYAQIVPTSGLNLQAGGPGQTVIAQGRLLDSCPTTTLTVATAGVSDRVDLIAIQATRTTGSVAITGFVRSDAATPQLVVLTGTLVSGAATVGLPAGYTVAPRIVGPFPVGIDSTADLRLVSVSTTQAIFQSDDNTDTRAFAFLVAGVAPDPTGNSGVPTTLYLQENRPAWIYVQNTSGTPLVAPPAPSGYDQYATVYVHANETSISGGDITYLFPQLPALSTQLILAGLNVAGSAVIQQTLTVDQATTLAALTAAATILASLTVTGNTTLDGTLTLGGLASFGGSVNIGNALTVAGATILDTTLNVLGNTDLEGTLNVDGATTLAALVATASTLLSLAVTNNATIGGTLGVTGNGNFTSSVAITGNATIGGTLGVTGATTGSLASYTSAVTAGSGTAPVGPAAGDLQASRSTTTGALILGGTSSNSSLDYGVNHAGAFTLGALLYCAEIFGSSAITAGSGTAPGSPAAGDLQASRSTTTGALVLGGSSSSAALDYGVNHASAFTLGAALYGISIVLSGAITASQFNGSGAGLTSGTVPTAALVSIPIGGTVQRQIRLDQTAPSQTLTLLAPLPAGNWIVRAHANFNTNSTSTTTLAGVDGGTTWEATSPNGTTTDTQQPNNADLYLMGTAVGGNQPSVTLATDASTSPNPYIGYGGIYEITCVRSS
jgi:hypothetical protein